MPVVQQRALVKGRKTEVLSPAEIQAGEIQKRNGEMVPSGRDNFKIECWLGLGVRLQSLPNSDFGQVTWLFRCLVSLFVKWRLVIFAKAMFPTFNPFLYIEEKYSIWLSLTPLQYLQELSDTFLGARVLRYGWKLESSRLAFESPCHP